MILPINDKVQKIGGSYFLLIPMSYFKNKIISPDNLITELRIKNSPVESETLIFNCDEDQE
jgi:hypothetical protein